MSVYRIDANASARYAAQLIDDTGATVSGATLETLTLTWTDNRSGSIINGRSAQNVLNTNGVTLDDNGLLVWLLTPSDTPLVDPTLVHEIHTAHFVGTWAGGTQRFEKYVEIKIVDPARACACTDCEAIATLRSTGIVDLDTIKSFLNLKPATAKAITSLSAIGTLATAVVAAHGYLTGQTVIVSGAVQVAYNGSYVITVLDANTFTYQFGGSGTTPATGTITVRGEDTSVDTILALIGNGISEWIERECGGRVFQPRCVREVQRGVGKAKIFLKKIPIVEILELVDNGQTIAPANYLVADPHLGMIELLNNSVFSVGPGRIQVRYTAGYNDCDDTGPLPSDAVLLCLELIKAAKSELETGAITFSSITAGPANVVVRQGMNPRHQRMLNGLKDTRI